MTEIFESTIDNVSDMDIKGYTGPDEIDQNLEIWVKSGKEEYIYKFHGPGVKKVNAIANKLENIVPENERLKEAYEKLHAEKEDLKKENEDFGNQILDYIEMNNRLMREKDELAVSAVAAKEKNKLLEIENEHIKENLQSQHKMVVELNQKNHELQDENSELKYLLEGIQRTKDLVEEKLNTREDILDKAKECVCGQREQDYGTPESNFQLIADLWNGYLGFMDHPQDQIRATDVAMMMALMKIARIRNGGGSGDSFVDLAGYAACGGEIYYGERHSST